MKHKYIERVFTDLNELKNRGIFLSGKAGEGEYREWYENGVLFLLCFYKNYKLNGEYKSWYINGTIWEHKLFENDRMTKNYMNK